MAEIINIIIALSIVMIIKDIYESLKNVLYNYYLNGNKTNKMINFIAKYLNSDKENYIKESSICIEEFDCDEN